MLFLFCFVLFCRFYTFTFLEILHWNMSKHKTSLIKCFWSICLNPCSSKPRYQFSLTIRVTGIQLQFLHYWPHNKLYFLRYWCGMLTSDRYDHIHFLCSAGLFCEFTFTHNWSSHLKLLSNNPCVQYLHHGIACLTLRTLCIVSAWGMHSGGKLGWLKCNNVGKDEEIH